MDTLSSPNLLETVQLIPIFNYLNILSDFLYVNNYLSEDNLKKQIPIVNSLHNYLEDNRIKQFNIEKLVRELLTGSDLYGAEKYETIDVIFANEIFKHIITSLVFNKYGNIYGFFVDVFSNAENLQISNLSNLMKAHLCNAIFENEYGNNSTLSSLSIDRIYIDIISPLFPESKSGNLSLLSLDYIYAQAGSNFLSSGKVNVAYYNNSNHYHHRANLYPMENIFQEYLIVGHSLEKFLLTNEGNLKIFQAFALPAIAHHVFNSKYQFAFINSKTIIQDPEFWQMAYKQLFQHTGKMLNEAKKKVDEDSIFKIHKALTTFRSRKKLAEYFINVHCNYKTNLRTESKIADYLNNPNKCECEHNGKLLPNLNEWYIHQITHISDIYGKFDEMIVQEAFGESFIKRLTINKVVIKLLHHFDGIENGDFNNSKQEFYDVLEFYFPEKMTLDHYILKRDVYNVTLINHSTEPEIFQKTIGTSFENFLNSRILYKVLKTINETLDVFWKNFIDYKKVRLESYLQFFHICQLGNEAWKNKFWLEFSLPLEPFNFSSSINKQGENFCEILDVKLTDKGENFLQTKILQNKTEIFLSSLGTTVMTIFLENVCNDVADEMGKIETKSRISIDEMVNILVRDIQSLEIDEPLLVLNSITQENINTLTKIINILTDKTNFSFTTIRNDLNTMLLLKSKISKIIDIVGENETQLIFINTFDKNINTAYGYKFTFLNTFNRPKIIQLRTDYKTGEKLFLLKIDSVDEKSFLKLNNITLKPEYEEFRYEINNQIRTEPTKLLFTGISTYNDDDDKKSKNDRQWRLKEKLTNQMKAVNYIQSRSNITENVINNVFNKYTFLDNSTFWFFIYHWLGQNRQIFTEQLEKYKIPNSDILHALRYDERMEYRQLSIYDGKYRINSLYTKNERREIESDTSIETIIMNYNQQKQYYFATFFDYYSLRNFATTGWQRIMQDTREAKLMKLALYKLAIRQSDDPIEEFDGKLFYFETKPSGYKKKFFSLKNELKLEKFTIAHRYKACAVGFPNVYPLFGYRHILYEMTFNGRYVRGKLEQFYKNKEEMIILLPGTKFVIDNYTMVEVGRRGNWMLKVFLQLKYNEDEKYEMYRNIMNEIGRMNL